MDKKRYKLVQTRTWEQNGEKKKKYVTVGSLNTIIGVPKSLVLDAYPLPNEKGEVWVNIYEYDEKDFNQRDEVIDTSNATLENDLDKPKVDDDEIPF
tara:strand:- start:694 stop:984 length:291 start_codon:yes stop_codon:yes gene_type:complete